jgi:hypothetical protein
MNPALTRPFRLRYTAALATNPTTPTPSAKPTRRPAPNWAMTVAGPFVTRPGCY